MVFLVVFTEIKFFIACLITDGKIKSHRINSETALIFPKDIIDDLLLDAGINVGNIDYIVFLGKPLAYFERLINLHIFFFPFSFLSFVSDFKDFFIERMRIKTLAKKKLGYSKDICFLEPVDVIAHEIGLAFLPKNGMVIVSLCASTNLKTLGCYKKEGDSIFLVSELEYPNCISMFYRLKTQDNGATLVKVRDLLKFPKKGSFILKRKFFQYKDGIIALKEGYRVEQKESILFVEEILSDIIGSTGVWLEEKLFFVSDYPVDLDTSERLRSKFKNLEFIFLNKIEIVEYAVKYTTRRLK